MRVEACARPQRTIARCRTIFAANCAGVSDARAPEQRPQAPLVTAGLGSRLPFLPPAASATFTSFHGALHGAISAAGYFQRARGRFAAARLLGRVRRRRRRRRRRGGGRPPQRRASVSAHPHFAPSATRLSGRFSSRALRRARWAPSSWTGSSSNAPPRRQRLPAEHDAAGAAWASHSRCPLPSKSGARITMLCFPRGSSRAVSTRKSRRDDRIGAHKARLGCDEPTNPSQ